MIDVQMSQQNRVDLPERKVGFSEPGKRARSGVDEDAWNPIDEHEVRG